MIWAAELLFAHLENAASKWDCDEKQGLEVSAQSLVHCRLLKTRAGVFTLVRSNSIEYLATFSSWIMALPAENPLMDCQGTKL